MARKKSSNHSKPAAKKATSRRKTATGTAARKDAAPGTRERKKAVRKQGSGSAKKQRSTPPPVLIQEDGPDPVPVAREQEIGFPQVWIFVRDFGRIFKDYRTWLFLLMGVILATKGLEVFRMLKGKPPLFQDLLYQPLKSLGSPFIYNLERYIRRIAAILYQGLLPFLVIWVLYLFQRRGGSAQQAGVEGGAGFFPRLGRAFRASSLDYGLSPACLKQWWKLLCIIFLVMMPFMYFFATSPGFRSHYPYLGQLRRSKDLLLFFQFEGIRMVYMFSWEFLFRGFMLNALRPRFGYSAIFVQMIPYVLLHSTKPSIELYYTILGGVLLGWLAYSARSIWPGFLLHGVGAVVFDMFALWG